MDPGGQESIGGVIGGNYLAVAKVPYLRRYGG